jgi:serine/threonine-protein kinase HipA
VSYVSYVVRRDGVRVGVITRTEHGSVFAYDADIAPAESEEGIAFTLPYHAKRFETLGVNLHPFFANLLPEGLRLHALTRRVKTSEDDLLGLLAVVGADCIGDISVVPDDAEDASIEPTLDVTEASKASFAELLRQSLAYDGTRSREPALPGAQEKVSAAMISFPVRGKGRAGAYILKLNPPDKPRLVENEAFFSKMADACGLDAAPSELITDRSGAPGLLVRRFDRTYDREAKRWHALHQEDGCQLVNRYPADKYLLDCRTIGDALVAVCTAPAVEALRYLQLWAFSYVIGNGDLHAKNVSVRRDRGQVRLTPAYDLLTTLPYGDRHMALKLGARDDNLRKKDFVDMGERFGVRTKATVTMLDELLERAAPFIDRFGEIGFEARRTNDLQRTARARIEDLQKRA